MTVPLSILGASARAVAASAVRGGFAPTAVDLFADLDTQAMARAVRIAEYPGDFIRAAAELPDAPWIYTGGLENYPDVVDSIAAIRPLWGNSGDVLRAVRDPLHWSEVLQRAGFSVAEVTGDFREVPRDGRWLAKPRRSAGGLGIAVVDASCDFSSATADRYFQQRIDGTSASAVFVAASGKARPLGATEQLTGATWAGAGPFHYCGSIGPLQLEKNLAQQLQRLGDLLANAFRLVGLFGVDGILSGDDFWPVEINPRYTASIEILERATGASFLQFHALACRDAALPSATPAAQRLHGKAIVYAPHARTFSSSAAEHIARLNAANASPVVADIPCPGEALPAGAPVVTVFATGETHAEITKKLTARCAELHALL